MPSWPSAPRRVPFRVAAQSCGPLGLVVGMLLVMALFAGSVEWSRDEFRLPRDDWRLDAAEPKGLATGTVESVTRYYGKNKTPRDHELVTFRFVDAAGTAQRGRSWIATGAVRDGDHHGVEYLPESPSVCRLRTGTATYAAHWLDWYAGLVVLPLALALGWWLAHVYKVRALLRNGRAVDAVVVEVDCPEPARSRKRRNGQRCRIRYRYRGPDGAEHEATQRPRLQSKLGQALVGAKPGEVLLHAFVVASEWTPGAARLVVAAEVPEDRA